jgi:predicted nucleic acid-binding protein
VSEERSDAQQGAVLRGWFNDRVLPAFAGRILPFDLAAARALATFRVPEHAPLDDALIAAVARANDLILVTRNTKHFKPLGVRLVNRWD